MDPFATKEPLSACNTKGVPRRESRFESVSGSQDFLCDVVRSSADIAQSVAIQKDGKVVVTRDAQSADGTLSESAIARFNVNSSLDSTFGKGGQMTTNFVGVQTGGVSNPAKLRLVQTDGKILVSGTASRCAKCGTRTALARYNSDGNLGLTNEVI
jgi:uncharacterized delta-60 repeat protein